MEAQGFAHRIYGGAILEKPNLNEPPFELREALHSQEKERIIRCAAGRFHRLRGTCYN